MESPIAPVTLTADQLRELKKQLGQMRHEINNQLSLMAAAMDVIRFRPEKRDRMMDTLGQQPQKIQDEINRFSEELEKALGFTQE